MHWRFVLAATAQQAAPLKPANNLVIENIPPISASLFEQTARYGESRAALVYDWRPTRRELLIGPRFGDTAIARASSSGWGICLSQAAGLNPKYITAKTPWDVEELSLSEDGKTLAFATNAAGALGLRFLLSIRLASSAVLMAV